jgi:hypothetical protein
MKELRLADGSLSPLIREEELLRKLEAADVCPPETLRLTITGRFLFVDGFVCSLEEKLQAEKACRQLGILAA